MSPDLWQMIKRRKRARVVARRFGGPIDLLATDLVLPGITGQEFSERILGIRSNLKVLYMSGYSDQVAVRHGVLGDQIEFLQKPYTPSSLARKAREALDRQ